MNTPLLSVRNLVKRYGALTVTNNLSLDILEHEVHAVIGPNGAGKTTLMGQLAGQVAPTSGSLYFKGEDITQCHTVERVKKGIARSFQITSLWPELSVLENVLLAVMMQEGHAFRFFRPVTNDLALVERAREYLVMVDLQERAQSPVFSLSHGEQRQLEIAVVLARGPELLLLDEPLAGMGVEDSARLVALLRRLKGQYTMLIVEHDMEAVFSLADRVSVLVYGQCIATGTPAEIQANDEVRAAYLGEDDEC